MRHSLHSHIIYLEGSIHDVRNRLTQPGLTEEEVEDLHLQLTLAEGALEHYRQAYALELSLSGSEPPNQPADSESHGGSDRPEKKPGNKKGGRAMTEAGGRKRLARTDRKRAAESPAALAPHARRMIALAR